MSSHRDQKGMMQALRNVGSTIKRSPQMLRKRLGKVKKRMGQNQDYSSLDGALDNGWLHPDERVLVGLDYKVKYLGSVEVSYDPSSSKSNQQHAQKAMRALMTHTRGQGEPMLLTVSVGRMQLSSEDRQTIIMRHSTSRVAYSTVDPENAKIFSYVALVKDTGMPLCHVFTCKSSQKGYELTFTCAQAFDMNFRKWQDNQGDMQIKAAASECGDVEPAQAWQKKKSEQSLGRATPPTARAHVAADTEPVVSSGLKPKTPPPTATSAESDSEAGSSASLASAASASPPSVSLHISDAAVEAVCQEASGTDTDSKSVEDEAAEYFSHLYLDVSNLSIDEGSDNEMDHLDISTHEIFGALSAAKSEPHLLDIGVEPEDYARVKASFDGDEDED